MSPYLFRLELRLLTRERAMWVLLALFAAALAYGLWNGARLNERQSQTATELNRASSDFMGQLRDHLQSQSVEAQAIAGRGSLAMLSPAPAPLLATGQSDLVPGHQTISLWKLSAPGETRSELENPSVLLAGRFDLAFVLVWLFPLFLLAFVYDLVAGDRESGTLRLGLAQGITPGRWLAHRALALALPVLGLAALATLAAVVVSINAALNRLVLAVAVVLAYGLFWVALAIAVNAVARSAAGAATALGATWVLLVLVVPTLLNVAVETLYPTPSRAELVAAGRKASGEAEKRGGELLNSFYRDHPELAPAGQQASFAAQHLTVQTEVGRAIDPVRQRFDDQLARQQTAVGRWRFLSPAIATYEALTDLAGTGYWRYRAFQNQTGEFKTAIHGFFGPKVHRREPITLADYDRLPRFSFREEPARAWATRVGGGVAGVLLLTMALGGWTWRRLRPARAGYLAS
jgi:ABC-2 type transport system permease protein